MVFATTNDPRLAPWASTINELAKTQKALAEAQQRCDFYRRMWDLAESEIDRLRAEQDNARREYLNVIGELAEERLRSQRRYERLVELRAL